MLKVSKFEKDIINDNKKNKSNRTYEIVTAEFKINILGFLR